MVVTQVFNPSTRKARQVDLYEFKASLVYRASSRTGSEVTEKPCLEKPKKGMGGLERRLAAKSTENWDLVPSIHTSKLL